MAETTTRTGVFETNSSSTHSLAIPPKDAAGKSVKDAALSLKSFVRSGYLQIVPYCANEWAVIDGALEKMEYIVTRWLCSRFGPNCGWSDDDEEVKVRPEDVYSDVEWREFEVAVSEKMKEAGILIAGIRLDDAVAKTDMRGKILARCDWHVKYAIDDRCHDDGLSDFRLMTMDRESRRMRNFDAVGTKGPGYVNPKHSAFYEGTPVDIVFDETMVFRKHE